MWIEINCDKQLLYIGQKYNSDHSNFLFRQKINAAKTDMNMTLI